MATSIIAPGPFQEAPRIKPMERLTISAFDQAHVEKACAILEVILRYHLKTPSDSALANDLDSFKFLALIFDQVKTGQPIRMCLPAFPFKSPNSQNKVLGYLPDKAEEFSLAHINGLCAAIGDIYAPGAELTIISDGLVYNDLLGVPDKHVWAYGQALRNLASAKGFKHIKFSRLNDLLHTALLEDLDEMTYVANATEFRRLLLNNFSRPNWDPSLEISKNEDTCPTYMGYLKFLETDLEHVYPVGEDRSKKRYKKGISYIAKQMLFRGDAFARAVRERFPTHIRLSIHPSATGKSKIPIRLLPSDSVWTTPWHCAMAVRTDGSIETAPRSNFDSKPDAFELVHDETGAPSYYREKTELLSWNSPILAEPLYPCGLLIRPAGSVGSLSIEDVDATKLRALAERNSPVVLRGFKKTDDRDLFIKKAGEIGTPLPWHFGILLEVKDLGEGSRGSGNSLSAETMPFHYDGVFKVEKRVREDGSEEVVSVPPRFQFFTAVTPSPTDTGYTLFASSNLLFRYLPSHLSLDALKKLTWSVSTTSFGSVNLGGLKLVLDHPVTGKPCLRYHEHWPQCRTHFEPMEVSIEGEYGGGHVGETIETLMYDRRVVHWHSWVKGDMLVSDNIAMMHTRSEFTGGCDRELWRIHID
ncbi:Pyoverdine/dityrosine biosynthesis protein-domain-containing protein [Podospora aff. communis PSN243]|uniref:Pyoverdine/dityrosine biosynthesis protein-domain-containing protein n=1 Tax=Podospora aff. communis PSN243 TaxID=3040156 RepID=A0AAV9GYC8_9PEZI|nr:Pyoverdine/dityrosine biosynthesis protein-domain-containing protein [Podospora aff. communis PSN243]